MLTELSAAGTDRDSEESGRQLIKVKNQKFRDCVPRCLHNIADHFEEDFAFFGYPLSMPKSGALNAAECIIHSLLAPKGSAKCLRAWST